MRKRIIPIFFLGAASWSAASFPAIAQSTSPQIESEGTLKEDDAIPASEIVVTAQKREQSVSKVGSSLVALGGEFLKERNVSSLSDLANAIPGLNFSMTETNTPVFTLRGVGFTDTTLSSYPDVSVYVDQVPLPFPVLTANANFDLERVEVLQGPQGTLFGSNATGGAINYVAAKPTRHLKGGMSITAGRFNDLVVDGFISGPLSDNLRVRLAGRAEHRDDWQYSYTRADTAGKISTAAARGIVDWDANDRLSLELNVNGWRDKSDPQQGQLHALALQAPAAFADPKLLSYPAAPHDPRAADWDNRYPLYGDRWQFQTTLRGAYKLTDAITLTSLTGFIRARHDVWAQADGVDLAASHAHTQGRFHDFFQELRLDNGARGRVRWTAGLNYQQDDVEEAVAYWFGDSTSHYTTGINQARNSLSQKTKNYAAFGNAELDILPDVTVKGGIRYTRTNRNANACLTDNFDGSAAAFFTFYEGLLNPGATIAPLGLEDCLSINPATNRAAPFSGRLHEDNISFRVGIDWRITPDILLYANISKGYKAGGFPSVLGTNFFEYTPVRQEALTDYEAGVKTSIFDHRIFLTASGFYYDYRDKQLRSKVATEVFGIVNSTVNIPKSSVRGGEIAVSTKPIMGFTPSLSATYLDATIDDYLGLNAGGQIGDFGGTRMPLAPKLSVNGDLQYEARLGADLTGIVGASVTYRSSTNTLVGGTPEFVIPGYALIDVRAGVNLRDGAWKISVFGKNIANKYYVTSVYRAYDVIVRSTGQPATYGVTISHKF